MKSGRALSVDDNEDDQLLLQRAWKKNTTPLELHVVGDGDKAIEYLAGSDNEGGDGRSLRPSIVFLDLKMPRKNGFEVLEWVKQELAAEAPPIAVFTSSENASDIQRAYELGARWYIVKPVEHTERVEWVRLIGRWYQNPGENDLSRSLHYRPPLSAPN